MDPPRIGITCSPLRGPAYYDAYVRAVEAAGGAAVRLEPLPPRLAGAEAGALLSELDGMLFPGGWDVDPQHYGEVREDASASVDPALDATEMALAQAAVGARAPVLGICRGQQLLNVALGGSLHQHVDGHDERGRPRSALAHTIQVEACSELAAVTGLRELHVNSLHHQAVKRLAPGLRVSAQGPDGIVEGVESTDGLVVAVQCHPEELIDGHPWALELVRRFVLRAAGRR